jgi:hypothetical protein
MSEKDSRGQAILIIALLLVVLIALMALVIDGGNAYAQRRRAQNAVDSSVLAGAQELTKVIVPGVTHQEIWAQIEDYAVLNGLDAQPVADYVDAWFIDDAGEELLKIIPGSPAPLNKHVLSSDGSGTMKEISGVKVEGALPFDTFFARIVGFDELTVHADAKAWILCGACSGSNLFPAAVSTDTFDITGTWPLSVTVNYEVTHRLWQRQPDGAPTLYPGSFGWVNWEPKSPYPQGPSTPVLADNIGGDDRSGLWNVWEWINSTVGEVLKSNPVLNALESRLNQELIVPVFGATRNETGSNLQYQIWGFASFELTCVHYHQSKEIGTCEFPALTKDDRWIEGRFHRFYANLPNVGSCPDLGMCSVKLRRPIPETSP